MIKVNFEISEDNKSLILNVKGHAGQNEPGKDIICASASILAYTLAQNVSDYYKCKKLRKKPTVTLKEGNASVVAKPLKDDFDEVYYAFYVIQKGYKLLAQNYPEYLSLKTFGES